MKYLKIVLVAIIITFSSCDKYLDIVPDNLATVDLAFSLRSSAEKYLFTCYSYMPSHGDPTVNPAFYGADELWHYSATAFNPIKMARGEQNISSPLLNYWDGLVGGKALYAGLRDCNIFLENINKVREMTQFEKDQWAGEVKFLKAYYHYWLLRTYGPIPIIRQNLSTISPKEEIDVEREPVDVCVNYIVDLLDEAMLTLPEKIIDEQNQFGRITIPIALAVKAEVLTTAASPLFNRNPDYANFKSQKGVNYFSTVYDPQKWDKAAKACKAAIDKCHELGMKLYDSSLEVGLAANSPAIKLRMSIRNSVTKKWNNEVIWGNTNSRTRTLELGSQARLDASAIGITGSIASDISPTLKMAEMYYTKNGVPINEDKTWDYANRYALKTATAADKLNLREAYQTIAFNFDREPRFYASLAFDGAVWFGQGKTTETGLWWLEAKYGQYAGKKDETSASKHSITGYWPQKMVNYENVYSTSANYTGPFYPFPVIRLADLYLLYAETLNEFSGPSSEVYNYINLVRARAGLGTVENSWTQFSLNPNKYTTKAGLRDIIHQERAVELAFEGHRYWDLLRWKKAIAQLNNNPVRGWDIDQIDAINYYREKVIYVQSFQLKNYFAPLRESNLIVNKNLVQNPGW